MNNKTKKRNNTAKFSYLFLFDLRVNICKNHPYWNLGGKQIDSGPFFSDSSYKKRVPGKVFCPEKMLLTEKSHKIGQKI